MVLNEREAPARCLSFYLLCKPRLVLKPLVVYAPPMQLEPDTDYPEGVELFDFHDYGKQRELLYNTTRQAVLDQFPQSYGGVRVELDEVDYDGPDNYSLQEQKDAILKNKYLRRRLKGTMRLIDEETGKELDRHRTTLLSVPFLTDRGTFIHNGNEIGSIRQARLMAGPYSRVQDSGQLETQFNVRVGTGKAFRVGLEPSTGQYRMKIQQSNLHLYSLLHDLGVEDDTLANRWGSRVLDMNKAKYDSRTLDKAYERLVPAFKRKDGATQEEKAEAVKAALEETQVSRRVAQRNLPNWFDRSKSAFWREKRARIDLIDEWLGASMEKRADFTRSQVVRIAEFLNAELGANIYAEGRKTDIEEDIMAFVEGREPAVNRAVLEAGTSSRKNAPAAMPSQGVKSFLQPVFPKAAEEDKREAKGQTYVMDDGEEYVNVGIDGILASSEKLLAINRGLEKPDDRDDLKFKRVWNTHDMIRERIVRDAGKVRRQMLYRLAKQKNLKPVHSGYFDSYVEGQIIGNPLSSPLEEINPMHLMENSRRMTLMGPGGIGSEDAITEAAQGVHASSFGFLSPIEGPESSRAGIDTRFAWGVKMGSDGRLYQRFRDKRTGRYRYMSPDDLDGLTIRVPD